MSSEELKKTLCLTRFDFFICPAFCSRKLDHPNIRLQLDIFHLQQMEGNICRQLEKLLPWVGHVQLAQVPGRGEPDSPGELDCKLTLIHI